MNILILLPIHLYENINYYIEEYKIEKIYLIEHKIFFDKSNYNLFFNILKPIYHRAWLQYYYDYLKKNTKIKINYIELNEKWNFKDFKNEKVYIFDWVDNEINNEIKELKNFILIDWPRFF